MNKFAAIAAFALITGACSGGGNADVDGDGEVSPAEAQTAAEASGMIPEPGLYKTTSVMKGIDVPGMPGHGAGLTTTSEECVTQEDVEKGFEEMLKQDQDGDCSYERFNLAGGKIDAVMVCNIEGSSMRMEMDGTASPTGSEFDATMTTDDPEMPMGGMTFNVKQERIGDCPAE
ncbi:MAG: DUF3617 domain-containing protein [Pseudomonadota bacterium]